jgi:hypothetical protein
MNKRALTIGGLVVAVAIASGAVLASQVPPPESGRAATPAVTSPSAPLNPAAKSLPAAKTPGASTVPPAAPAAPSAPGAPATPTGTAERFSTEVLPPASGSTGTTLPPSKPLPTLVAGPLPKSASAAGKVVSGFPSVVLPAVSSSVIITSSVATQGSHLQVALEAQTSLEAAAVITFYREHFAPLGLLETRTPSGTNQAVSFERDGDSVTITLASAPEGTRYVIFGTFTARR